MASPIASRPPPAQALCKLQVHSRGTAETCLAIPVVYPHRRYKAPVSVSAMTRLSFCRSSRTNNTSAWDVHGLQRAVSGECGVVSGERCCSSGARQGWFCHAGHLPQRPHPPAPLTAGETEAPHVSTPIVLALLPCALRYFLD